MRLRAILASLALALTSLGAQAETIREIGRAHV